jgi:hypothetical protein
MGGASIGKSRHRRWRRVPRHVLPRLRKRVNLTGKADQGAHAGVRRIHRGLAEG